MSTGGSERKERPGRMRRFMDIFDAEEKGYPPKRTRSLGSGTVMSLEKQAQTQDDYTMAGGTTSTVRTIPSQLLPKDDRLQVFRVLTGINTPEGLSIFDIFQRSASNIGIYTRTVRAERRASFEFRLFSILINCCLGLQIVFAASLTALGAGNGPRSLVTAFGAINTVIAGFLTYLKGSGLPNRKRYYQNEWTRVRLFIEQREREFCLENCELDVQDEIYKIERMYEDVCADIERNTPETFTGVSTARDNRTSMPPSQVFQDAEYGTNRRSERRETQEPAMPRPPAEIRPAH